MFKKNLDVRLGRLWEAHDTWAETHKTRNGRVRVIWHAEVTEIQFTNPETQLRKVDGAYYGYEGIFVFKTSKGIFVYNPREISIEIHRGNLRCPNKIIIRDK